MREAKERGGRERGIEKRERHLRWDKGKREGKS